MSVASICNTHTGTFQRKSVANASASNLGTPDESWAAVYTDVRGNLQPLPDRAFPTRSGTRIDATGKRDMERSHVFYTPTTLALQPGDRLLVGSTYYMVVSWADMAGRGRAFSVFLLEQN